MAALVIGRQNADKLIFLDEDLKVVIVQGFLRLVNFYQCFTEKLFLELFV